MKAVTGRRRVVEKVGLSWDVISYGMQVELVVNLVTKAIIIN